MQLFRTLLLGLLLATQSISTTASDKIASQRPFYFPSIPIYEKHLKGTESLAKARFGENTEPWLPRVLELLKKNRPPAFKLDQVGILRGDKNKRYLVLNWNGGRSSQSNRIEFHKIRMMGGRIRLNFLRQVSPSDYVSVHAPTGQPVFPNEPTIATISFGGGSWFLNYGLRLIQMKRNTVDITPDWAGRVVDVIDLNQDGSHEVVAMDDLWSNMFHGCGACGPHVPVVLVRKAFHFQPACNEFKEYFLAHINHLNRFIDEERDKGNFHVLGSAANILLSYLQIGSIEAARKSLDRFVAIAKKEGFQKYVERAMSTFEPLIKSSKKNQAYQCTLSATKAKPRHDGAIERIDYLLFNSQKDGKRSTH